MSTSPPPAPLPPDPVEPPGLPPGASGIGKSSEIKLISHSNLFYWWPVWAMSLFMAMWTWVEGSRLAIVPAGTKVTRINDGSYNLQVPEDKSEGNTDEFKKKTTESLRQAEATSTYNTKNTQNEPVFRTRVSEKSGLGIAFVIGLILTIVITNVPLRGLWSFLVIVMMVLLALLIVLFEIQEKIFDAFRELHIHINMAGYLFICVSVFIVWAMATFIFDRRSYIIFTPGQIRVCEHIGASVQAYGTVGVNMEKQRDDLFRHYILGFGSGDLIVRIPSGGEQKEIRLPNILGVGWRLKQVEDMLRQVATT